MDQSLTTLFSIINIVLSVTFILLSAISLIERRNRALVIGRLLVAFAMVVVSLASGNVLVALLWSVLVAITEIVLRTMPR